MRNFIFVLLLLCTTVLYAQQNNPHTTAQTSHSQAPVIIGDEVNINLQTPHPYNASSQIGVVFEQEFYNKNSAYIKLYFENFDLGPEDYVEISTHNTGESIIYAGKGKIIDKEGTIMSDFWSQVLLDERVTVRLHAQASSNHHGFKISKVAYGYSAERIDAIVSGKSICGTDDKERMACYNGTIKATRGRAVCKLIIGGVGSCTGWLLGCEGHVMTNNHCIGNATTAGNTDFLFDFQYSSCTGTSSLTSSTVATSATFIKTSSPLDYTLVKLPTNPTPTYGYLSLSSVVPVVGDRIYIIGHPGGRRKEITVNSDQDASGFAQVNTINTNGMRYFADTEGGSSGSPVLSNSSNLVFSIHNTGSCSIGNGSSGRCDRLITDIGTDMPNSGVDYSACGGSSGCTASVIALPQNQGFETNFGIWSNESTDDFDWTRKTGSTSSTNTGPTAAAEGAYYAYMESSFPNYGSKTAILNSPCFNVNVSNGYVRFKYHMYGSTTGNLRFQVSTNNGSSWTTLWTRSGDQGNNWLTSTVNVSSYINTNGVRFRFFGTTGTSFTGDIAIDDISVYTNIITQLCQSFYPYKESWETGFGIWSQSTTDDFDWTRKTGSTSSSNTGPTAASDGNYYIYTESSFPNYANKTAIITSRCFNLTRLRSPAAIFRYHMYGATMGKLVLQVSVNNSPLWATVWTQGGDQGNSWKSAYVNLSAYSTFSNVRFRFVGTTSTSFTSDMAIDAFSVQQGLIAVPIDPIFTESNTTDVSAEPFLTVSPNPFNDLLNVSTNIEGLTNYRLVNVQGQTIKEGLLQGNRVEVGEITRGVYFLTLYNKEEQLVRKVIKQ